MITIFKSRFLLNALTALTASLPFCSTTGESSGKVQVGVKTPLGTYGVQGSYEYKGTEPDREVDIKNDRSKPICFTVEFLDKDGKPIDPPGAQDYEIPPGGTITIEVPPGTKKHKVTEKDCPEGSGRLGGGMSPGKEQQLPLETYYFWWGTAEHDITGTKPTKEVHLEITTNGGTVDDASLVADFIYTNGPNAVIPRWMLRNIAPEGIEVLFYLESFWDGGNLNILVADETPFRSMDLQLNGAHHSTLSDGVLGTTVLGWRTVRFVIPASDFNYFGFGSWTNTFQIVSRFNQPYENLATRFRGEITFTSG